MANNDDLYFVRMGDAGPIKIGRSKNVTKRIAVLQVGSPQWVEKVAVLPNEGWTERVWHRAFADHRTLGEWFEPDAALLKAIKLAAEGRRWWDHLWPPGAFSWSEDSEQWGDDICDWQISIQLALSDPKAVNLVRGYLPGVAW